MRAVRILQGYLWLPREHPFDPRAALSDRIEVLGQEVRLLLDPVEPPFAFFDDGTPSASQRFYQVTLLWLGEGEPPEDLPKALADRLDPRLNATPPEVGWLLLEDLREV